MTVRYKSATVDEFIEHHSHDVSRGGIFIKTPSPFPPGTLLKFEIRIQDEQSVLAGVGRVVWKRDAGEPGLESPAGMGVKFIKIDDKSKGLIQRLVESQPEGTASAFEAGKDGSGAASEEPASDDATKRIENPAAAGAAVKPAQKRASTMLGLGSIGGSAKGDDKKESTADAAGKDDGFFPRTNPEKEMPPPEERTVMKQAAELLKQALAEAGGSLDDLKDLQAPTKEEAKAAAVAKEEAKAAAKVEPAKEPEAKKDDDAKEAEAKKDDVKAEAVGVAVAAVVKAAAKDEEPAAKPKAAVKEEPKPKPAEKAKPAAEDRAVAAKPAPKPLMQEPEESGGSGKMLTILLVVAGLGAAAWLLFGRTDPSSTTGSTPENTAPTAMTAPVPTMTAAPMPTMTAAPVPTMTAAPTASASSSAGATPSAVPTATAAAVVKTAAPEPPKPPPVVKPPTVTTPPVDRPKPPPKPKPEADPYG